MPRPLRASTTAAETPRSAKDFVGTQDSLLRPSDGSRCDSGDSTDPDRASARDKNLAGNGAARPMDDSRSRLGDPHDGLVIPVSGASGWPYYSCALERRPPLPAREPCPPDARARRRPGGRAGRAPSRRGRSRQLRSDPGRGLPALQARARSRRQGGGSVSLRASARGAFNAELTMPAGRSRAPEDRLAQRAQARREHVLRHRAGRRGPGRRDRLQRRRAHPRLPPEPDARRDAAPAGLRLPPRRRLSLTLAGVSSRVTTGRRGGFLVTLRVPRTLKLGVRPVVVAGPGIRLALRLLAARCRRALSAGRRGPRPAGRGRSPRRPPPARPRTPARRGSSAPPRTARPSPPIPARGTGPFPSPSPTAGSAATPAGPSARRSRAPRSRPTR